jgi:site-specific DNA-methyltransferase (adenine-specific)
MNQNNPTRYVTEYLDLRLMDCMELMAQYPDKHFGLAIIDPPYGIGMAANPVRQKQAKKDWDSKPPDQKYFIELQRVSKNQIVWGANHFIERIPKNSPCWIVWDKQQPHNISLAAAELAWTSFKSPVKKYACRPMGEYRIHPTQKPVKLYSWLLSNYAKPGDKILDTHLGSGSIAIACHYAKMHLTACEIDPDYFRDACERIARETSQTEFSL